MEYLVDLLAVVPVAEQVVEVVVAVAGGPC